MQWDAVVAIPGVKHILAFPTGYLSRLVERGLRVVGLAERMLVQGLEVNGASLLANLQDECPGRGPLSLNPDSVWPRE